MGGKNRKGERGKKDGEGKADGGSERKMTGCLEESKGRGEKENRGFIE